jgi:hypothetical protein
MRWAPIRVPSSTSALVSQPARQDSLIPEIAGDPGQRHVTVAVARDPHDVLAQTLLDRAWARCTSFQRHLSAPQIRRHPTVHQSSTYATLSREPEPA